MTTKVISINELQNKIPELLAFIAEGDNIIIEKDNKPFARLIPVSEKRKKRIAGLNKGEIWMSEDFDEPLPDEFWTGEK